MILLYLLGCSQSGSGLDSGLQIPFYPPSEKGPFEVGTEEYEAQSRHGFALPVQAWFPSSDWSDDPYPYLGTVSGTAFEDSPADCTESRPVVVFSHGNGGIRYQSFFLAEHLASHGYLVIAPDHVGNTFFSMAESRMAEMLLRRPQDVSDAFDWLLSEAGFTGCVDEVQGYAVVGHSFGGYTAFASSGASIDTQATASWCAENGGWLCGEVSELAEQEGEGTYALGDSRVWAGVPLAPAGYEALLAGLPDIEIPMAVFGGDADTSTTMEGSVLPLYTDLVAPKGLGVIKGAGHYAFSDMCTILPSFGECTGELLPTDVSHSLINASVTAFLGLVRGEPGMAENLAPSSDYMEWSTEGLDTLD
jgi:predicted dienelactone hydrolase